MGVRLLVLIPYLATPLAGLEGPTDRVLCDPEMPDAACPTPCICIDDRLEVVFDGVGTSVLEIDEPSPGLSVAMSLILAATSPMIQGWSYGVAHDRDRIILESVTHEGTDADLQFNDGFRITTLQDVLSCEQADPACAGEEPGGGYIAAYVLGFRPQLFLARGRNSISKATYKLLDGPTVEMPIQITLSESLRRRGSPPVVINITEAGRSARPMIVSDGWILAVEGSSSFHRGDPDGDGHVSVIDAVSLLLFLFLSGPGPSCLEAGDFDDDGRVDGTDPILILRWLFLYGSSPSSPGPPGFECGADPEGSPSQLGCAAYPSC